MKTLSVNEQISLLLLRAGLWENEVRLPEFKSIDFNEVYRIASEQAIVGLVVAGLEHVTDVKAPQEILLAMIGDTLQLEQRNHDMNEYISELYEKFQEERISSLLMKGQGIAQCYEKPLWRASGDIDLLLSGDNYEKAKRLLLPLAAEVEPEHRDLMHLGLYLKNGILVELHGTLRSRLTNKMDRLLDSIQNETAENGRYRVWENNENEIQLLNPDDDVFYVFSHILHHFFIEGVGLRQVCDWCRLLWTYRDSIDNSLLEMRLKQAGVVTEWKAFAALAVDTLGMPIEAIPFYSPGKRWRKKSNRILSLMMETGNFGHNRDMSYYTSRSFVVRKVISLWRHMKDCMKQFVIFPMDAMRVGWRNFKYSIFWAVKEGESSIRNVHPS